MNNEPEARCSSEAIEELRIEIASLRLKVRAVMTYLVCARDELAADETLAQMSAFLEGTGLFAVPADQMGARVRDAAALRARQRMARMACDLHSLPMAPARRRAFTVV